VLGDFGMNVRDVGRRLGKTRLDLSLLLLQFVHPRLHRRLVHTIFDGVHDPFDAPLNLL